MDNKDLFSGDNAKLNDDLRAAIDKLSQDTANRAIPQIPDLPDYSRIAESLGEKEREKQAAILQTAKSTKAIQKDFEKLHDDLSVEREERKSADEKNQKYTRRYNRFTGAIAILALIVAILAFVFPIVKEHIDNITSRQAYSETT